MHRENLRIEKNMRCSYLWDFMINLMKFCIKTRTTHSKLRTFILCDAMIYAQKNISYLILKKWFCKNNEKYFHTTDMPSLIFSVFYMQNIPKNYTKNIFSL